MSTTTLIPTPDESDLDSRVVESGATTGTVEDAFDLNVQVIMDVPPGHPLAGCSGNTDDGCDPTCASACVTGGV